MFDKMDSFRDELCTFDDPNQFELTNLGDEMETKDDDPDIGMKRKAGTSLDDGPMNKKQKLMSDNDNNKNNNSSSKMDIDSSDDTDSEDDDMNTKKRNLSEKRKLKLSDKYKDDEDFQIGSTI